MIQSLAVAGLNLEAGIQGLEVNPEVAVNQLRGVQDLLVREQRELRSVIDELKLATLVPGETDFKIGDLLQQLAKTIEGNGSYASVRKWTANGCFPVLAREIYQIIREGLVNVPAIPRLGC